MSDSFAAEIQEAGEHERILEEISNLHKQTIYAHGRIIKEIGGASGIRDEGALESALGAPFATFFGEELLPTPIDKAAALMRSLSLNHPFVDGNKRISLTMTAYFLLEHGRGFRDDLSDDEMVNFCLEIAEGKKEIEEIAEWLRNNTNGPSARSFRKVMEQFHRLDLVS